jgi:uncharacterized protein (TIGR02444 family)
MTLWDWATAAYARQGVEAACLDLQDSHRQSVPYLLWAAWAAAEGRPLSVATLAEGAALASRWEQTATAPLRLARRGLKAEIPGVADAPREALRAQIKALELQAEQTLMLALEALTPVPSRACPCEEALAAAARAWSFPAPPQALHRLAMVLG